jgi:antitoxin CcdA
MPELYDVAAPKKATNVSLNSDLLQKARSLKINLSAALEKALKEQLQQSEAAKWKAENKIAMEAYNEFVSENGSFGDEYRTF